MVLTRNQTEVTPKGFLEKRQFNSFMVLDTVSIQYPEEQNVFGYSIEILNLIRVAFKANKMCLDFKSDFRIDTDIYHKAISCVLNNESFSGAELESYFETAQKKEEFLTFSRSLADIENEFYLPFEVDYILLGMNMDAYNKFDETQRDGLSDSYGDIECDMRLKTIEIKDFIAKAKELFNSNGVINITT